MANSALTDRQAPYIAHLAAMLLLTSPLPTAFLALCNFLARPCLRAFFTETKDEIDAYYRVLENLQGETFPKIYANCKNLGLRLPESYFRSVLVEQIPFEACCRLWDQIVLDGDGFIFRAALAIFGFLEPRWVKSSSYYRCHPKRGARRKRLIWQTILP